jgi:hypothetical protein
LIPIALDSGTHRGQHNRVSADEMIKALPDAPRFAAPRLPIQHCRIEAAHQHPSLVRLVVQLGGIVSGSILRSHPTSATKSYTPAEWERDRFRRQALEADEQSGSWLAKIFANRE